MAIRLPARIATVPTHSSAAIDGTDALVVAPLEKIADGFEIVLRGDSPDAGPTVNAEDGRTNAAEPTHHQAANPSRYPAPAAPTVDPPPMFAASSVAASIHGPSARPATKKSLDRLTRRAIQTPRAICASE